MNKRSLILTKVQKQLLWQPLHPAQPTDFLAGWLAGGRANGLLYSVRNQSYSTHFVKNNIAGRLAAGVAGWLSRSILLDQTGLF